MSFPFGRSAKSLWKTINSGRNISWQQVHRHCLLLTSAPALTICWAKFRLRFSTTVLGSALLSNSLERYSRSSRARKEDFPLRKHSPVYHPAVQCKIASLLGELEAGTEITQKDALDHWLSRYYFNSGIQRVTFAAERLVATFAALSCKCGSRPPEITIRNDKPPKFKKRLNGAQVRLAHVETEYSPLPKLKAVLGQLATPYDRNEPFDPARGLAMIRLDVNNRKHSVYKRSETLDSLPRSSSGTVTWSDAGSQARMETGVACVELVALAYGELLLWHPLARF